MDDTPGRCFAQAADHAQAQPNGGADGRSEGWANGRGGTTRTLTVRVELTNRGGRLRPGMFASVRLGQGARDRLLVPSEAVIRTGRRTLVMLANSGGRFRPAEVRTGAEGGGKTEILAGLAEGEKVADIREARCWLPEASVLDLSGLEGWNDALCDTVFGLHRELDQLT